MSEFLGADSTGFYVLETQSGNVPGSPWVVVDSTFFVEKGLFASSRAVARIMAAKEIPTPFPATKYRPGNFDFRPDGIYLTMEEDSTLLVPVNRVATLFPEYPEIVKYPQLGIRFLNLYWGPGHAFIHLQGECLDSDSDCRQTVIPVSKDALFKAHQGLQGHRRKRTPN